jgi:hypothetical protein
MQTEKIIEKLEQLNGSSQKKVAEYVNFLYQSDRKKMRKKKRKTSISGEKIIGMWAERKEMKNSTKWVRKIRAAQSQMQ